MLVNPLSGSVGPGAAEEARRMLDEHGVEAEVVELEPGRFVDQLETAMESRPDVLLAWCTNYPAAPLAADIEAETGIPFWDATALGLLAALQAAGIAERPGPAWGSMLA